MLGNDHANTSIPELESWVSDSLSEDPEDAAACELDRDQGCGKGAPAEVHADKSFGARKSRTKKCVEALAI